MDERAGDRRLAIDRFDLPLAGETVDHSSAEEAGRAGQNEPRRSLHRKVRLLAARAGRTVLPGGRVGRLSSELE